MTLKIIFLFIQLILAITDGLAQVEYTNLNNLSNGEYLGSKLKIYMFEKNVTIDEIFNKSEYIFQSKNRIPRFGYTHKNYWARIDIQNDESSKDIFFEFYAPIEKIYGYQAISNKINDTQIAGMFINSKKESFVSGHNYPTLKFTIPNGKSSIFFTMDAVAPHFPIRVFDQIEFYKEKDKMIMKSSIFIGVCISLLALLMVVFVMAKKAVVLLLISALVNFFLLASFLLGIFRSIFYASSTIGLNFNFNYITIYKYWFFFSCLYFLSLTFFSINVIGKKHYFGSIFSKSLSTLSIIGQVLFGIVSLYDQVIAINIFSFSLNLSIYQAAYWSLKKYREGQKEQIYSTIAWASFSFLTTIQIAYFFDFIDIEIFRLWGTMIGFLSMIFLLATSIVEKLRLDLASSYNTLNKTYDRLKNNFKELKMREETIRTFSNPIINTELSLGLNPMKYEPRREDLCVMFYDMRNFTHLSQILDKEELHYIINLYIEKIIDSVQNAGGHVEKIIGDAVMCSFKDKFKCFTALCESRDKMVELNRQRYQNGKKTIHFGTGVAYGDILSANFGTLSKMDRTIIGDIVNIAARLEGITKQYFVDVILDESVLINGFDYRFLRPLGIETPRGSSQARVLYEYYGHNNKEIREIKSKHAPTFRKLIDDELNHNLDLNSLNSIEKLINQCPKHQYKETIADSTLLYLKDKIESLVTLKKSA
ncbi:MAG: hypothetical protein H6622_13805 [Halobacteriovoraceae bacterium]|nr:hypothetical protein [Halobacteriovoraceae bacterium]